MTILQAIITILKDYPGGLNKDQITEKIMNRNLYYFNTPTPSHIVYTEIRRHCQDVNIGSSRSEKFFYYIESTDLHGKNNYALLPEVLNYLSKEKDLSRLFSKQFPKDIYSEENVPSIEEIKHLHDILHSKVKRDLLDQVLNGSYNTFENVVVTLLQKLGYVHTFKSNESSKHFYDGVINGIIYQDPLGLDKVYLKATCYSKTQIANTRDIKSFVSEMGPIKKGIYITTSSFSTPAKLYAETLEEKQISLIDCDMLIDYMMEYKIGIRIIASYDIIGIDKNFFSIT